MRERSASRPLHGWCCGLCPVVRHWYPYGWRMRLQSWGIGILAVWLAILGAAVALPRLAQANCLPTVERQRIEALIGAVERRADVTFIRNGRPYGAATAAQFLRGKWRSREADICSAADFIAKAASFSSTTGDPYLVRLREGREMLAAEFFRAQLAQLRPAP
jgi:hypothetical protein